MPPSRFAGVECFWVEPTGRVRLSLRRFYFSPSPGGSMPAYRYRACEATSWGCDASVALDEYVQIRLRDDESFGKVILPVARSHRPPASDSRWPIACAACGRPFDRHSIRQVNQVEEYRRADGSTLLLRATDRIESRASAGALYDCWWHPFGERSPSATDGIELTAVCPDGTHWHVDREATGGGFWTRRGNPRDPATLTVSPSIQTGTYHGFLQGGRFTDDLGS